MNRCQFCAAPATIHLTDIQNNVRREMHLCERCGREHDLIPESTGPQLNLPALLSLLLSQMVKELPAGSGAKGAKAPALTCPDCGLKYAQFRTTGRFGCPGEYETFREPLLPLLERIHRGLEHAGKVPKRLRAKAEVADLQERLAAAIAAEDFETAAALRDELKKDCTNG